MRQTILETIIATLEPKDFVLAHIPHPQLSQEWLWLLSSVNELSNSPFS